MNDNGRARCESLSQVLCTPCLPRWYCSMNGLYEGSRNIGIVVGRPVFMSRCCLQCIPYLFTDKEYLKSNARHSSASRNIECLIEKRLHWLLWNRVRVPGYFGRFRASSRGFRLLIGQIRLSPINDNRLVLNSIQTLPTCRVKFYWVN